MLPNQTEPIVTTFDPCAVSMVNEACLKQNRRIVLHTSWIRTGFWKFGVHGPGDVHDHCISQGILPELFHKDLYCCRETPWRYDRINKWLIDHPEVDDYFILDDEPDIHYLTGEPSDKHKNHLILTDFDEGITMRIFRKILDGTAKITE